MRKKKEFVITSFFGEFFVLLPLLLLWKLFAWLFRITSHTVSAPAHFIIALTGMWEVAATGLSLIILAAVCFLVGVFAKSRFGEFVHEEVEKNLFKKIPLYGIVKEALSSLRAILAKKEGKLKIFIAPVLFLPFGESGAIKVGVLTSYPMKGYCGCEVILSIFPPQWDFSIVSYDRVFLLSGFSALDGIRIPASGGIGAELPPLEALKSFTELEKEGKLP